MTGVRFIAEPGFEPTRATPDSAGYDLRLCTNEHEICINPGEVLALPTSVFVALDPGYALFIHSRSGLARRGLVVANGVGVVDADYRGEVRVLLRNESDVVQWLYRGDRIAQAVVQKVERCLWHRVEALDETTRGAGGFGSTGR